MAAISYKLYHWVDRYIGISLSFVFLPMSKVLRIPAQTYRKILIIRIGKLGDAILLIPVLRALKEKFSQAHLAIICSKENSEIFKNCPYLDERIIVKFSDLLNPASLFSLIKKMKKNNFDLAIDSEQWFRFSGLIALFSFAKKRIGFRTKAQFKDLLFTDAVLHVRQRHEVECFLDLLRPLGIQTNNKDLKLWPAESNIKEANNLLKSQNINSNFIVFHTEVPANGRQRQWPIENFAKLGEELIKKYGFKILVISTYKGKPEARRLNSLLGYRAHLLVEIPILTLYVMLSKAKFVVSNNTGFMHLAASARTSVIGLHGPTSPVKWGPWGNNNLPIKSSLACSPCLYLGFEYGCKTNRCMKAVLPQEVLDKIDAFLAESLHMRM